MGCQCCRMIKSYIYDPSVAVDGGKPDPSGSSLYQPRHRPGGPPGNDLLYGPGKQKQGFHNLGYSKSNESTLKLEADNNHVNQRLHAALAPPPDGPYIIQPGAWADQRRAPSQVPVYPDTQQQDPRSPNPHSDRCRTGSESLSADDVDEGVGGDTGDEGSVLSVDIHTSNTSLSSADNNPPPPKTPDVSTAESGISVMKSEDEGGAQGVTDSMVAEALAALEAATAGEDSE